MEPPPPLTLGDNPVAGNKLDVPYGGFDWAPLWMSLTAGMSTCLGAIWVFCHRPPPSSPRNRASVAEVIRPSVMCFSLALAGSVMITVSVVSIIPECLRMELNAATEEYEMIPIFSAIFMQRLIFHVLGYVLYFLLAKFAFPEPDEILGLNTAKEAEMLTIDDSNNMSHVPNNNAYDDSVEDSSHFQKEISSEKARLRRISGDIVNSTSRPMNGHSTHAEAESNEEIECASAGTKNNNSNNKSNTNAAGCLGKLSRYSSGDDLESTESKRAWRVAMLLAVSLSVHNFPEGLAIAASAMKTPQLGIKVTIGIMIHNIPEGIAIAVPCIAARPDSPWLAFWLTGLSGLAEPFGAFVALFILRNFDDEKRQHQGEDFTPTILNIENVLAFVSGMMIMVAAAELFPEALRHTDKKEGKLHLVGGTLCGIAIMVATELYLA